MGQPDDFMLRSGMPGNIGTLKARIVVWDHDPLVARANQVRSYGFPQQGQDESKIICKHIEFNPDGSVSLKPLFIPDDMFVAAWSPRLEKAQKEGRPFGMPEYWLEYVGTEQAPTSVLVADKLPGGTVFYKGCYETPKKGSTTGETTCDESESMRYHIGVNYFSHQLWIHIGSLLDPKVYVYPSEYNVPIEDMSVIRDADESKKNEIYNKIEAAPKFDYDRETIEGKPHVLSVVQINKSSPEATETCHWTLEKYMPLYQGQDFFVTITRNSKGPDMAHDPEPDNHDIEVLRPEYVYLHYTWSKVAVQKQPKYGHPVKVGTLGPDVLVPGISNEAFYVALDQKTVEEKGETEAKKLALRQAREQYYWKYKSYILIELGVQHNQHNYFIELCRGRNPRLLHLGWEWDNPNRISNPSFQSQSSYAGEWTFIKKCRVLGLCDFISCDALFQQEKIQFAVRNHLGKIIITFQGYEDQPWVIERLDTEPFKSHGEKPEKLPSPMVVPPGRVRIHGGNLSCKINFSPLTYAMSDEVAFTDLEFDSFGAEDKDLYMTFAHAGCSVRYEPWGQAVRKKYFNDTRFPETAVSYDCDAALVSEVHRNLPKDLNPYEAYPDYYGLIGKGFLYDYPRAPGQTTYKTKPETDLPESIGFQSLIVRKHSLSIVNRGRGGTCYTVGPCPEGTVPGPFGVCMVEIPCGGGGQKFTFGLGDDPANEGFPYSDYVSIWNASVVLASGDVLIPPQIGPYKSIGEAKPAYYQNVITPIGTSWRIFLLGGVKPFQDKVEPFDIAPLVTSLNENWSADEYFFLDHYCDMAAYIPISPETPPVVLDDGTEVDIYALGQKLVELIDKTFYLTIAYWWEIGVGIRQMPGNELNPPESPDDPMLIQMTGLAYGGKVEIENNKQIFRFHVLDYSDILAQQPIMNSPFFDAVPDVVAIHELAKMAGFDDDRNKQPRIDRRPLGFIQRAIEEEKKNPESTKFVYNGEKVRCDAFALKGSYADIANPAMKFDNLKPYLDCMREIAQQAQSTLYFDRWGVLRYETLPAILVTFENNEKDIEPKMDFTTTPFIRDFDPREHVAHLVYQVVGFERSVQDCINQIVIVSAGNDVVRDEENKPLGGFIIEGYTFYEQLVDPNAEGFIGYRKPFAQMDGFFGGVEQVRRAVRNYARMKYPPIVVTFETYGVPGLKALDIITLDGQKMWIKEVSHEIDPEHNRWWMTITGEWFKPFEGELSFLQTPGSDFGFSMNSGQPVTP
jgi:hypothetical protein